MNDQLLHVERRRMYRSIVEEARQRIRGAPDRMLTLDDVAQGTGISPVRLHQVFRAIQGENFGAYVRRARLEYACGLMRAFPNWTCTQIALEAGYSEGSDFSRSFKRAYGMAPSHWDRVSALNLVKSKFKNCQDNSFQSDEIGCVGFAERPTRHSSPVVTQKDMQKTIACLEVRDATVPKVLHQEFDRFEYWLKDREQLRDDRRYMGLSYDSNLDTAPDLIRFELAYEVDQGIPGDGDFVIRSLPERRIAKLACRGGIKDFVAAWDYLLRTFLPQSRWRFGEGPQLEVYYNDPRNHGMLYWDMDCVIPVQTKMDGTDEWNGNRAKQISGDD